MPLLGSALTAVGGCLRLGLAGGSVYLMSQEGCFGTVDDGCAAYQKCKQMVAPMVTDYTLGLPSGEHLGNEAVTNWNSGMKTVFGTTARLPEITEKNGRDALIYTSNYLRAPQK